jgi:hypothetical protein
LKSFLLSHDDVVGRVVYPLLASTFGKRISMYSAGAPKDDPSQAEYADVGALARDTESDEPEPSILGGKEMRE